MIPRLRCLFFISLFLSLATAIVAQSKAPLPTLTTEDVLGTKTVTPAPAPSTTNNPTEKPATQAPAAQSSAKTEDEARKKAEKDWNERLKKAQEKLNEIERQADQTELQITQLRNQLFSATARAPEANGQINTRISELTNARNRLRADAQTAQQAVTKLEAEGKSNTYKIAAVSLTNDKGEPDATAYHDEQNRLRSQIQDAQARVEVLQIRLNTVQAEVLKKGNGDNFTLNRLRQERDQLSAELRDTQTKIATLKNDLETHRQKAVAVGVKLP